MNSGVYAITTPSGHQYVGSALNFSRRFGQHRTDLRRRRHRNVMLQRAVEKYGLESLSFSTLIICRPEDLILYEQIAIDALAPAYNIRLAADTNRGLKRSEESKAKMAKAREGRKLSEEHKANIGAAGRGKKYGPRPPEWRASMSEAAKRRWARASPDELRERAAIMHAKRWPKP